MGMMKGKKTRTVEVVNQTGREAYHVEHPSSQT
jgi:hypothetical protein